MASEKINLSLNNPKVAASIALGIGVLAGVGTVYALNRVQNRSRVTEQISHLHSTILDIKSKLAIIEKGLGCSDLGSCSLSSKSEKGSSNKKSVSFSASSTASYKTARDGYTSDCSTTRGYDTDYLSFDEDEEEEFFDISPSDTERDDDVNISNNESINITELSQTLRHVDELIEGSPSSQQEAWELLQNKIKDFPNNSELLWRLAKATRNMAVAEDKLGNKEEKQRLIFEAYNYAKTAVTINYKSAQVHKWFGILSGERGEYMGMKERIAGGHVFKKHIDIAVQLNPNDATLHHLLGRFCFEVCQLSWIERKAAATLFGEVPSATVEESLQHFLAANDLHELVWKENCLFVSKCYQTIGNKEEELAWLRKAVDVPIVSNDDEIAHQEAVERLSKLSN